MQIVLYKVSCTLPCNKYNKLRMTNMFNATFKKLEYASCSVECSVFDYNLVCYMHPVIVICNP